MPVEIKYTVPQKGAAEGIRYLFRQIARGAMAEKDVLERTNFNDLLDQIAQEAFEAGIRFGEERPRRISLIYCPLNQTTVSDHDKEETPAP